MSCAGTHRDVMARCHVGHDSYLFFVDANGVPTECMSPTLAPDVEYALCSSYTCRVCGSWFDAYSWNDVELHWKDNEDPPL